MTDGEKWWKESNKKLENDPEYLAEAIATEVAARVQEAMTRADLTQKDLAKRLQVSQPYISQVLSGRTNLTILTLCKLSVALQIPVEVCVGEPKEGPSTNLVRGPFGVTSPSYQPNHRVNTTGDDSSPKSVDSAKANLAAGALTSAAGSAVDQLLTA